MDDAALRLEAHSTAFDAAVTLASRLEYTFATQAGSAHVQLSPVQFDPSHLSWRKMVPLESFPVNVTGGHLSATASLTWGPEAGSGSATIMLEQLSGQYESIAVNGLTTTLNLQTAGADMLTMPEPARVTIAALQTGVEVTDLSLDLQLGWIPPATLEWVAVRNVSAAVLGGRVTSEGGRLDVAHPNQTFTVKAEQLDLQQLLHLEQQKGMEGTGVLDGVIPIILTPTRAGTRRHTQSPPTRWGAPVPACTRNRPGGRPSGFAPVSCFASAVQFSLQWARIWDTV